MLRLVTLLVFLADFGIFLINSLEINGWYPCTITDSADQSWLSDITFECATVEAPLCHPGICTSSKTIELFVKRKLATVTLYQEQTARKSLWLLAGGPGASSVDLELAMILIRHGSLDDINLRLRSYKIPAQLPELELNDNAFSMLVESLMEEQRDQMLAGIDYGQ
ncbi:putative serine protease family S33 [Phytophthora cinnamomi]|uniref:putative serine protease family S33 n=1 Tax=Phytophthora cinnamomi TaxID=4785 RepID=UPI00355A8CF9|nr:putative serine protease family S33 [Phytophthora cinnamomi]